MGTECMSNWDIHDLVRQRGGDLFVGWEDPDTGQAVLAPNVERCDTFTWTYDWKLLVLQHSSKVPSASSYHLEESPGIPVPDERRRSQLRSRTEPTDQLLKRCSTASPSTP